MLYIGIPVYNEAPTIGVVLWQIRAAFQTFAREYEILVYDDASTDATAEVLRPYADVLPLTVRRGDTHLGYGRALEAVCRAVAQRSRHARRDALITMQGDFTDSPGELPELIKRFEGGADIVVVERPAAQLASLPPEVRRFRRVAPWVLRRFVRVPGIADPFGSFRLYRVSVLREALKRLEPDAALIAHTGWTANVEILRRAARVARRVDTIELPQRYDLRPRPSRIRPFADALSLYRYGRSTRSEERLAARAARALVTCALLLGMHGSARAQDSVPIARVPFGVGEHAEYNVKFGIIRVGSGTMDVTAADSLRGHAVWHAVFHIQGGTFFYHVNDQLESWFDARTLSSLRFLQHLEEGGSHRQRDYEIYPERQVYVENQKPEQPSVAAPLDDVAFLYFIRTIPLVVGETLTFNRYFNPKSNPVTIRVLRRESVSVPAGKFAAIVIQPVIKTSGIFSQNGEARVWLSDDSARVVLQLKSKLSFGSLDLYLRSFRAAPDAPSLVYALKAGRSGPDSADAVDSTARASP